MSEEETPAEAAPAKSNNKVLPMVLVINTLLLTGVLVFVMKRPSAQAHGGGDEHAAKSEHTEKSEHGEKSEKSEHGDKADKSEGGHGEGDVGDGPGPTLRLDAFVVQVRSADGDRYAHITIEVELGAEADKKAFEVRMPRLRDAIIAYMSDRTEDELRGSEGLGQMKTALTHKIDDVVPGHRTRGLFITEFIIQ